MNARQAKEITAKMAKEISESTNNLFFEKEVFPAIIEAANQGENKVYVYITAGYSNIINSAVMARLKKLGYTVSYYSGSYRDDSYFCISW